MGRDDDTWRAVDVDRVSPSQSLAGARLAHLDRHAHRRRRRQLEHRVPSTPAGGGARSATSAENWLTRSPAASPSVAVRDGTRRRRPQRPRSTPGRARHASRECSTSVAVAARYARYRGDPGTRSSDVRRSSARLCPRAALTATGNAGQPRRAGNHSSARYSGGGSSGGSGIDQSAACSSRCGHCRSAGRASSRLPAHCCDDREYGLAARVGPRRRRRRRFDQLEGQPCWRRHAEDGVRQAMRESRAARRRASRRCVSGWRRRPATARPPRTCRSSAR